MTSPQDRPVMFRAGAEPGLAPRAALLTTAPKVLLADISEFEPDINDAMYLLWSKAVIIRAAYGDAHDDHAWYGGQRRDLLRQGGVRFLGIYQYVVAGQDITAQAQAFCLIGQPRPGEYYIADIEEGTGDLRQAWQTWVNVVRSTLGAVPVGNYSGLNFAAAHGLAPVDWVAAYQAAEPTVLHELWQFTDAYQVPGIGTCDCSVYHGTIDSLAALAYQGAQPAPAPALNWTETLMQTLPVIGQGATGEDVRTLQGALTARHQAVTVDGAFGPATRTALETFQRSAGLTADGIAGPATWPRLLNR